MSVTKPNKGSWFKESWALVTVIMIWILTSVSNVPMFLWSDLKYDSTTHHASCLIVNVDPETRLMEVMFVRTIECLVPLFMMWICYSSIIYRMKKSGGKVNKTNHFTKRRTGLFMLDADASLM
jgi:hypothetical protein